MSWAMAEVYGAVTDQILINMAHYFPLYKPGQQTPGSFEYQARMLAQVGQVNRDTVDIIMKRLTGVDEALRSSLEAAITDALKTEEPKLRQAVAKGMLQPAGFLPPEVTPNQMQAFKAYYEQSADRLNLVNTVMLESTEAAYRATVSDVVQRVQNIQRTLNVGTGEVVTGVSTWNQALQGAVRKMVDNGITGLVDHGGHHWAPETYVAMDIRTTMFNVAREAIWERAETFGSDLYQVSSHNGARPLCYPWQGKVISRSDMVREVEDRDGNKIHVHAQSETSYGQPAGLFGINCKHYPMTFIPGISTIRGEPQDPEENERSYAESQEQRALERKLRMEKRDLEVLKAQGASEAEIRAQRDKIRAASADIDDFCDKTGRARRRNREYTPVQADWKGAASGPFGYASSESIKGSLQTEWPKGDGGIPADRLQPIADYAFSKGVNININTFKRFEGSEQTLVEVIDSVSSVCKDFPLLSDLKKGLVLSNGYLENDTFAQVKGRTLYINNNAFRNRNALEKEYQKCVSEGLFPAGTTAKGIGFHESGHLVRNLYKLSLNELTEDVDPLHISLYAYKNKSECVAESFNACYSGLDNSDALTVVQRCRKIINDRR